MSILEIIFIGLFAVPAVIGLIVYQVTTQRLASRGLTWDGTSTSDASRMVQFTDGFDFTEDLPFGDVNPANGLPMVGATDIKGNPFGTNRTD